MSEANGTLWRIAPRYERLELSGDYAGVWAEMLINAPQRVAEQLGVDLVGAMVQLIRAWNVADAAGTPIDCTTRDGLREVPSDVLLLLVRRWNEARMLPLANAAS